MPTCLRRTCPALLVAAAAALAACTSGRGGAVLDEATRASAGTESCRGGGDARPPAGPVSSPGVVEELVRAEICLSMDRAAAAWNRGALEVFMDDYADSATYVGSRGLLRGRTVIGAHYAPRFATGATRDSLSFRDLDVRLVSPELAQVVARWVLSRGDSVASTGWTSLLMRRTGGRWSILHDHSS